VVGLKSLVLFSVRLDTFYYCCISQKELVTITEILFHKLNYKHTSTTRVRSRYKVNSTLTMHSHNTLPVITTHPSQNIYFFQHHNREAQIISYAYQIDTPCPTIFLILRSVGNISQHLLASTSITGCVLV